MAVMQCDICGQKLTMDVSGLFATCDVCGLKHPKERLRKKVAELKESSTQAKVTEQKPIQPIVPEIKEPEISIEESKPAEDISSFDSLVEEPVQIDQFSMMNEEPVITPAQEIKEPEKVEIEKQSPDKSSISDFDILLEPESKPEPEISIADVPIMGAMEVGDGPVLEDMEENAPETGSFLAFEPEDTVVDSLSANPDSIEVRQDISSDAERAVEEIYKQEEEISQDTKDETDDMTPQEREQNERRMKRVQELKDELKEFVEIYEENKGKFIGEGLKKKNYAETKIKEIQEKLSEYGALDEADEIQMSTVSTEGGISSNTRTNLIMPDPEDVESMTPQERDVYERKMERIKELSEELKEFEDIFEENRTKFIGEGLRKKNYAEVKIKEIKEKLEELGVTISYIPTSSVTPAAPGVNAALLNGADSVQPLTSSIGMPEEEVDLDSMTPQERDAYERKVTRIKELTEELREFEQIFEENKTKFIGEGLKKKNYAEIKIKEIREKLEEIQAIGV